LLRDTLVLLWAVCRDIILMELSSVTVVLRRLSADHVSAVDQRKKSLMVVSVMKLQEPLESLRQAIELRGGFEGLGRNDKVLIKPNICLSEWMPLYGLVTTTSLLEGLVQLLVEQGCHDISISEGPVDILALSIVRGCKRVNIYSDSLPKWERYRSGEFDPNHFRASRLRASRM
jgi:hypothetical protein